ncbi:hypothetical protein ROLI_022180 [Roseobacter fucihabitans]|uniref:Uncharacterized protein n=1 Tax=Roseobacter fucihabitans TaxID=1537242 RepID=A0ABZ2BSZ6_9RHOB|nr:hypothetical protein [Roseobacter litoralis]
MWCMISGRTGVCGKCQVRGFEPLNTAIPTNRSIVMMYRTVFTSENRSDIRSASTKAAPRFRLMIITDRRAPFRVICSPTSGTSGNATPPTVTHIPIRLAICAHGGQFGILLCLIVFSLGVLWYFVADPLVSFTQHFSRKVSPALNMVIDFPLGWCTGEEQPRTF